MGLVGAGFVGPHHIDAVRRLGFVDVVALAGSSDESARNKAQALGVPKSYGQYKPLAMTAADAKALVDQAHRAGVVHAVTFNYRGNPLVQEARRRIANGDIG